jgi:signal transduction histidine kinase
VTIALKQSARFLRCSIIDDGAGFDVAGVLRNGKRHGLGLAAMRERMAGAGGTLGITSQPGRGTEICARIKLPKR